MRDLIVVIQAVQSDLEAPGAIRLWRLRTDQDDEGCVIGVRLVA